MIVSADVSGIEKDTLGKRKIAEFGNMRSARVFPATPLGVIADEAGERPVGSIRTSGLPR